MNIKNLARDDTSIRGRFSTLCPDFRPCEVYRMTDKASIYYSVAGLEGSSSARGPFVGGLPELHHPGESDIDVIYDWMRATLNSLYDALSLNFFKKGKREYIKSFTIYIEEDTDKTNEKLNLLLSKVEGYRQFRNVDAYFLRDADVVGATNMQYQYQSDVATLMVKGTSDLVEEVSILMSNSDLTVRPATVKRVVSENGGFKEKNLSLFSFQNPPCNFYPCFDQTPEEVWDSFSESKANVLLLIGEPGTGKSNFIRQMMEYRGYENVPYLIDNELLLLDPMLISYLQGQKDMRLMVAEDADNFVAKRENDNKSMVGLLNMSSGIAAGNTKIILSTNLSNINKVDPALVRPGRCFKILTFEKLSPQQSAAIGGVMNTKSDYGSAMTLAEVLNGSNGLADTKKSFGFNQ